MERWNWEFFGFERQVRNVPIRKEGSLFSLSLVFSYVNKVAVFFSNIYGMASSKQMALSQDIVDARCRFSSSCCFFLQKLSDSRKKERKKKRERKPASVGL